MYDSNTIFSFSPNPVGNERTITLQLTNALTDTEVTITIYSIDGKMVDFSKFWNDKGRYSSELQIDQSLPTGIYLIEVKNTKQDIYRKKIILK